MNSAIYRGYIRHRRFVEPKSQFSYNLHMFLLDLDELDQFAALPWCSLKKFAPVSCFSLDHIRGLGSKPLKHKVIEKAVSLGAALPHRIELLANLRYFGLYFSPVNFYFLYDEEDNCQHIMAEVSNTPWNQKYYYLIEGNTPLPTSKNFHVSPFQGMQQEYHWQIQTPPKNVRIHIENHTQDKAFDATLALRRFELTPETVKQVVLQAPLMTVNILGGIYWQALKLLIKKAKFYGHEKSGENDAKDRNEIYK